MHTHARVWRVCRDWYEPYALVRSEELDHISGMLVALNAFDFNLYVRGDDLERRSDVIDWSAYLRDSNTPAADIGQRAYVYRTHTHSLSLSVSLSLSLCLSPSRPRPRALASLP
jgi:hypothetical protein